MTAHRFRTFTVTGTRDGELIAGSAVVVDGVAHRIKVRAVAGCGWRTTSPIMRLTAALAGAGWRPFWDDRLALHRHPDGTFTVSAVEIAEAPRAAR